MRLHYFNIKMLFLQYMKLFILTFFAFVVCLTSSAQTVDTTQQIIPGRVNSAEQQKKPYVIMISADGFRYDYAQKYKAKHLLALSEGGVSAESMIPSYPSLTFPNHYTLVTGLYPSHHGIVHNDFYDPARKDSYSMNKKDVVRDGTWYGGTPLWVLAEQQKMLSASFYWVASEANVKGIYPTYYYQYNTQIGIKQRIQTVVDWLNLPEEKRPHFITFYFPEVDHEGHAHGPDGIETQEAVHYIDQSVYQLTQAVKATGLDVNFILVSDHGMTKVDTEFPIPLPSAIDEAKFKVSGDGILIELYANNPADIEPTYQKLKQQAQGHSYQVYLKSNVPIYLHYGTSDDVMGRIGDILLIPTWPKVFKMSDRKINMGWHGYDPYQVKDMHATFLAWGPAFKKNLKIPSFENVNVFPVVTTILGLKDTDKIDGTNAVANEILNK
jgi:predicted AlkP superfamily pyrophosphatase or phosphodiesterase